jgi:hypothetical protein
VILSAYNITVYHKDLLYHIIIIIVIIITIIIVIIIITIITIGARGSVVG